MSASRHSRRSRTGEPASLSALLQDIETAARSEDAVSIETVQHLAGHRFSGPMLLVPGLIAASPLSGIPLVPSFVGLVVFLVCVQLIAGRHHLWLPQILCASTMRSSRVVRTIAYLKRPASYLDAITAPRMTFLTKGIPLRLAAAICLVVAITMPPLELLPFTSTLAGMIIAAFGLALTTRDGLAMLVALVVFGAIVAASASWFAR